MASASGLFDLKTLLRGLGYTTGTVGARMKALGDDPRFAFAEGDAGRAEIIAFIDEGDAVREILAHLGEPVDPPCIAPAHGPPLWETAGSGDDELLIQPLPEYEFDQRIAW